MALTLVEWGYLFIPLGLLLPITYLLNYYRKTHIPDYLLLVAWFGFTITSNLIRFLGALGLIDLFTQESLLAIFLVDGFISVFIFLHVLRLKWKKFPWYINGFVMVMIFLELVAASRAFIFPPTSQWYINTWFFLWQLAGWTTFLTLAFLIYTYATTTPLINSRGIIITRSSFILFGCVGLVNNFLVMLWPPLILENWELSRVLWFVGLSTFVFIALRYPEAILYSHAQFSRALNVYSSITSLQTEKEIQNFGLHSLVAYIKQVPIELIDKSKDL